MQQISIFTENKKGATRQLLSVLSAANINVLGLVSNDGGEFGVIRMLVSDTELAAKLLTESGYQCKVAEVLGIEVVDEPGSMEELLRKFENMNVSIDYVYVGYIRECQKPVIVLHTPYLDVVTTQLVKAGYNVF